MASNSPNKVVRLLVPDADKLASKRRETAKESMPAVQLEDGIDAAMVAHYEVLHAYSRRHNHGVYHKRKGNLYPQGRLRAFNQRAGTARPC